jgi:hypothetical protein
MRPIPVTKTYTEIFELQGFSEHVADGDNAERAGLV